MRLCAMARPVFCLRPFRSAGDSFGGSAASLGLIEQALRCDEDTFVGAVYLDGWEEYAFGEMVWRSRIE